MQAAKAAYSERPSEQASKQAGKPATHAFKKSNTSPASDDSHFLNASSRVNSRASVIAHKVQVSCIGRYKRADGYASMHSSL